MMCYSLLPLSVVLSVVVVGVLLAAPYECGVVCCSRGMCYSPLPLSVVLPVVVVVLCVTRRSLRAWLLTAHILGLHRGEHVFIYLDHEMPTKGFRSELHRRSFWEKLDGTDFAAKEAYENLIVVNNRITILFLLN